MVPRIQKYRNKARNRFLHPDTCAYIVRRSPNLSPAARLAPLVEVLRRRKGDKHLAN